MFQKSTLGTPKAYDWFHKRWLTLKACIHSEKCLCFRFSFMPMGLTHTPICKIWDKSFLHFLLTIWAHNSFIHGGLLLLQVSF